MANYVVGVTIPVEVPLIDADSVAITTAVDANFTETIRHKTPAGARSAATVGTWVHDTGGIYYAPIANALEGTYSGTITYNGTPKQVFTWDAVVETAAQDDPGTAYGWTSARFAKLDLLGTATAVALSPVNTTATVITIERGDDETIAVSEPSAGWSSLVSAASVTLALINRVNATVLSVAGTVTSTTPGSQAVSFALTDAQTDALRIGTAAYRFNVKAILSDGDDETLALGTVNVRHGV